MQRNYIIHISLAILIAGLAISLTTHAKHTEVTINKLNNEGIGKSAGKITFEDTQYGLVITPKLIGLPKGLLGFHIHTNPDCGVLTKNGNKVAGLAAGGHFDPKNNNMHLGPYDPLGHLGDLPPLYVDGQGKAFTPALSPRLKLADVKGRSIMIHAGGDNFSDKPKPLGGGGARLFCGVIN